MRSWWSGRRVARALRHSLKERRALAARPWEEKLLHWARDGSLHGHLVPPVSGRRLSTTEDGWCPGWAVQVQRQYLPDTES